MSSLNENVFNHVYSCENTHKLWKTIIENHEDTDNAESMYSRLNTLVNEINSLGVKQIDDTELIRKILHSLRRSNYDLVITVLNEKELNTLTPNQVLNKVFA